MDDARRPCSALAWLQEVTGGAAFRLNPYRAVRGFAAVGSDGYHGQLTIHLENLRTLAEKLPPAPFFYEAWLVTAAGQAVSAGAFNAGVAGSAGAGFDLEPDDLRCSGIPLASISGILITAEPFDGNPAPASPILQGRLLWQGEGTAAWASEPAAWPAPAGALEARPAMVAAPGVTYTGFPAPPAAPGGAGPAEGSRAAAPAPVPGGTAAPAGASGVETATRQPVSPAAPVAGDDPAGAAVLSGAAPVLGAAAIAGLAPAAGAAEAAGPAQASDFARSAGATPTLGAAPTAGATPAARGYPGAVAPDWGVTPPSLVPRAPTPEPAAPVGHGGAPSGPEARAGTVAAPAHGLTPSEQAGPESQPAAGTPGAGMPASSTPGTPAAPGAGTPTTAGSPTAGDAVMAGGGDPDQPLAAPSPPPPVAGSEAAPLPYTMPTAEVPAPFAPSAGGTADWGQPPAWPPAPLLPEALQRPPGDAGPPGGPVLRAQTVLTGASPLTAMTQAIAQLDFAQGGLLLTLRGMPAPGRFGSAATGREYNGFKAWLVSSRTREAVPLGALPRIWHDTYRIQVRDGLPLERFDTLQVTVEDRTGPAGLGGPIVLSGRYASLLASRR